MSWSWRVEVITIKDWIDAWKKMDVVFNPTPMGGLLIIKRFNVD